ncbi:GT2 family glycosyltransferase [Tahibacter aquaticus]|uniref:GT2 family glycosyltransferase n=1 Tax=Tahibacter aquaticus TaxID=520092 RepID=A0A4R6YSC7_9GAMM|nr:glycosyltransferase [Tahibacter aquaticus]TDR41110.1 GT2 family glycosyltransferase [Tahibacter aquaticus]
MSLAARTSLILLAWNRWELTARALDSLLGCALPDCDILVVDNGSSDATPQRLAAYAPRVRSLRLPHNLGFVRGNNAGIAAVAADSDVVLLNNDLVFGQRDWLQRLRRCVQDNERCGIAGCRLVDGEGRLLHAGTRLMPDDGAGVQTASGRVERDMGQYSDADRRVEGVVFAAVYIRRAVIEAIGPLHTDYVTYGEDSDYCLRAAAAGWQTWLCGGVTLQHEQHGSSAGREEWRAQLQAQGRATLLQHWGAALRQQYDLDLHIAGALDFPRETARWLRPLARALDLAGVRLTYRSLYAAVLPEAIAESGDSQDVLLNMLRRRTLAALPEVVLCAGDMRLWPRVAGAYRIGLAAFETLADDEIASLRAMDEIWVAAQWQRDELLGLGVEAPVHWLPFGIDPAYAHPRLRVPRNPAGERVVLCVAQWDELDRPWQLLQTWTQTFRREDKLRLLLWLDAPGIDLAAATRALALDPHGGRYSLLPQRRLHEEQHSALFAAADAVIVSSRSRQRSWAALQALAVGKPLLAPDHGICAELLAQYGGQAVSADAAEMETALLQRLREWLADWPAACARAEQISAAVRVQGAWAQTAQRVRERLQQRPPARLRAVAAAAPQQPLVVLGMHRSGTSCVAGLLQLLGAYGGEPEGFLRNPQENPRGFLERGDLHLACVEALRSRGGDWSVPLGWDTAALRGSRQRWRDDWAAIQAQLRPAGTWFVKEPRLCLLLDEIADSLADAVFVHVIRPPAAVAASLLRRDGLTAPHALALWEHHNRAALALTHQRRSIVLDYHCLLREPLLQLQRLRRALQDFGLRGLREPAAEEVAAWVGPQLARQRLAREPQASAAQTALWQWLQQRAADAIGDAAPPAADDTAVALLQQIGREHRAVLAAERERS